MTPLKRGDKVRVRVHTGEVVEAVYREHGWTPKTHLIEINSRPVVATWQKPSPETNDEYEGVRFVWPILRPRVE